MRKLLAVLLLGTLFLAGCSNARQEEALPTEQPEQAQQETQEDASKQQDFAAQEEWVDPFAPEDGAAEQLSNMFYKKDTVYFVYYFDEQTVTAGTPVLQLKKDGTFSFYVNILHGMSYIKGTYAVDSNQMILTETKYDVQGDFDKHAEKLVTQISLSYHAGVFIVDQITITATPSNEVFNNFGYPGEDGRLYYVKDKPAHFGDGA